MTDRLRVIREIVREEPVMHRPILEALAAGPLTVPEIAATVGKPASEVVIWVMGMRRYGLVAADGEADEAGYFRYGATRPEVAR